MFGSILFWKFVVLYIYDPEIKMSTTLSVPVIQSFGFVPKPMKKSSVMMIYK